MPKFFFDRDFRQKLLPEIFQKIKQQRLRDFPQALLLHFVFFLYFFMLSFYSASNPRSERSQP